MDLRISLLRIVACFMVILLHSSAALFITFNEKWAAGNFYDSLVRPSVPLFLMIAGATLLPKQEAVGTFLVKRLVRIMPPLLFWSIFYLWWLSYNGVSTGNWITEIFKGPTMYHLWYFYALVGLYLFVPVLRKFFQNSSQQEKMWFILTWFAVASIIPTMQNLLFNLHCDGYIGFDRLSQTYHLHWFGGYLGYLMLGAYAAQEKRSVKTGAAIFIIASSLTMVGSYLLSNYFGKSCEFFYVYLSPFVVAAAYGLFSVFISINISSHTKLISTMADCTLGIYGIHVFIIAVFNAKGISVNIGSPWITVPLFAIGVFIVSFVTIFLVRLVKPFRYVI